MFMKIRVLCLVIILITCGTMPGITESKSLTPDNTELSAKDRFYQTVKNLAGIITAAYKIYEREGDIGYDIFLYSSEFPSKLAWLGEKWQETAEWICFYYEMMAAIIEKDVAIYLTKDLRLLFANKFIEEGYIKVFFEGQNVSFIHMSDGYVLLSRMNLIFKEKLDKMNNMLNDFTDLYSAAYDKENDEVSIFFTDNKIIDPYNENMVEFVNVLAEVLEISENHLGVDVRIEYSFNNCGYLVYRELDDIIGYRMLNNEEPERIFSYLTYQFMKDK